MTNEFTPQEVADLAGAPRWTVEKAIEQNVLAPDHGKRGGRRRRRLLPLYAVAYVKIINRVKLRLDLQMKRRLARVLEALGARDFRATRIELTTAVELDVGRLVGDAVDRAERYGAERDARIVECGGQTKGEPFIRGSGVSVYALAERLAGGQSVTDIQIDHPELSCAAIEAADIYARAHPPLGAPPRAMRKAPQALPLGRARSRRTFP